MTDTDERAKDEKIHGPMCECGHRSSRHERGHPVTSSRFCMAGGCGCADFKVEQTKEPKGCPTPGACSCSSETARLTERLAEANAVISEIAYYIKDHVEPGHECVQCIIQALIDGKLKPRLSDKAREYLEAKEY